MANMARARTPSLFRSGAMAGSSQGATALLVLDLFH
jgi:hypothetical protein